MSWDQSRVQRSTDNCLSEIIKARNCFIPKYSCVRLHRDRLPPNRFTWTFILQTFTESRRHFLLLATVGRNKTTFLKLYKSYWVFYLASFLGMKSKFRDNFSVPSSGSRDRWDRKVVPESWFLTQKWRWVKTQNLYRTFQPRRKPSIKTFFKSDEHLCVFRLRKLAWLPFLPVFLWLLIRVGWGMRHKTEVLASTAGGSPWNDSSDITLLSAISSSWGPHSL